MRGFIVRSLESPRRSNLDASLDGVSNVHAADRSIEKFLAQTGSCESLLSRIYARQIEGDDGRKGRFDEFRLEQVFWKRDTVLAFSGGEG